MCHAIRDRSMAKNPSSNLKTIPFLVQGDVTEVCKGGKYVHKTPLGIASEYADLDAIEALLKAESPVDLLDGDGITPMMYIVLNWSSDDKSALAVAEKLFKHGADLEKANPNNGMRAIHFAVSDSSVSALTWLIAEGADINAKTHDGRTPFMCLMGNWTDSSSAVGEVLLSHGADIVSERDARGWSALHWAVCSFRGVDAAKWMISQHATDLDLRTSDGSTLLMSLLSVWCVDRAGSAAVAAYWFRTVPM